METSETSGGRRGPLLAAIAGAAAVAVALFVSNNGNSATKDLATLDVVEPGVSARFGDDRQLTAAASGQSLAEGDELETAAQGLAKITYFDGSITRVGPSSTLAIDDLSSAKEARSIKLDLVEGRSWHRVNRTSAASADFEVHHDELVVRAKGTAFAVSCLTEDQCRIDVVDGTVEVRTPSGSRTLSEGDSVVVDDGTIGETEELEPDDWIVDNRRLDGEIGGSDETTTTSTTSTAVDPTATTETTEVDDEDGDGDEPVGRTTSTTAQRPAPVTTTRPSGPTTTTTTPGDVEDPDRTTTTTGRATTSTAPGDNPY